MPFRKPRRPYIAKDLDQQGHEVPGRADLDADTGAVLSPLTSVAAIVAVAAALVLIALPFVSQLTTTP